MKNPLIAATILGAVAFFGSPREARADLQVHPVSGNPVQAFQPEAGGGAPAGEIGYVNGSADTIPAGTYLFTYLGHGDSGLSNSFTVTDSLGTVLTFCTQFGMAACGFGPATPLGTTVALTFTADTLIPFSFTSPNGTVTHDSVLDPSNVTYLASIPGTTNNIGPGTPLYLGFSDRAYTIDQDYQDLVVRVSEVPEPGSLSFLAVALIGLAARFRRT